MLTNSDVSWPHKPATRYLQLLTAFSDFVMSVIEHNCCNNFPATFATTLWTCFLKSLWSLVSRRFHYHFRSQIGQQFIVAAKSCWHFPYRLSLGCFSAKWRVTRLVSSGFFCSLMFFVTFPMNPIKHFSKLKKNSIPTAAAMASRFHVCSRQKNRQNMQFKFNCNRFFSPKTNWTNMGEKNLCIFFSRTAFCGNDWVDGTFAVAANVGCPIYLAPTVTEVQPRQHSHRQTNIGTWLCWMKMWKKHDKLRSP